MDPNVVNHKKIDEERSLEELKSEFQILLKRYQEKSLEIKNLKEGVVGNVVDEQVDWTTREKDKERNSIHKQLKILGGKLGKSEVDIMTDILRQQGSLAEYGLPEFAVLTPFDLAGMTFNDLDINNNNVVVGPPRVFTEEEGGYRDKPRIDENTVLIVYEVSPQYVFENYDGGYMRAKDYFIREKRAKKLAKELGLKFFNDTDYEYFHDSTVSVMGVVVPKDRLVEVAKYIRSKPNELRLGKGFYSEEERDYIDGMYKHMIEDDTRSASKEDRSNYLKKRRAAYGDEK